jgi:hypothetical protein
MAVDKVGQAGKSKTNNRFKTHYTTVLYVHSERDELDFICSSKLNNKNEKY